MSTELPEGHSLQIRHIRPYNLFGYPEGKGGQTIAEIRDADHILIAAGIAKCRSTDNFSKRLGRTIATGRALKNLRT